MKIIQDRAELRQTLDKDRNQGRAIAFVPTMGALHRGHHSLIEMAKAKGETVVVSIYVNPTQFGQGEDFKAYPRDRQTDLDFLEAAKVDVVFTPDDHTVYPEGYKTKIVNIAQSTELCGKSRPGHFDGMLTVVCKLLNLVQPDYAVFGLKDYQQYSLVRTMTRDLFLEAKILGAPTVREPSGLAMSSRNKYLSPESKALAAEVHIGLQSVKKSYDCGERSERGLLAKFTEHINRFSGFDLDYVALKSGEELAEYQPDSPKPRVLCAVKLNGVRLIDNLPLFPEDAGT